MNSMQLPKQWELIGLFESEPVLTDPNLPWVYNGLTFSVEREGEAIEVEISPSYGQLAVELRRADGTTRLRLDLNASRDWPWTSTGIERHSWRASSMLRRSATCDFSYHRTSASCGALTRARSLARRAARALDAR
jgi:hypothetical protein